MLIALSLALLAHAMYHLTAFRRLKSRFEEPFYIPFDVC